RAVGRHDSLENDRIASHVEASQLSPKRGRTRSFYPNPQPGAGDSRHSVSHIPWMKAAGSTTQTFRLPLSRENRYPGGGLQNSSEDLPMKSPFPGMDPYIEDCGLWGDFHHRLISSIADALADAAPERYLVRTEERSYLVLVESDGKTSYPFLPDVSVTAPQGRNKTPRKRGGAAVAEAAEEAEPVTMRAFIEEEHREAFVEIYEATPEQRLVTCIEVLSPSNKRPGSDGRDLYLRKRQSLLLGD